MFLSFLGFGWVAIYAPCVAAKKAPGSFPGQSSRLLCVPIWDAAHRVDKGCIFRYYFDMESVSETGKRFAFRQISDLRDFRNIGGGSDGK